MNLVQNAVGNSCSHCSKYARSPYNDMKMKIIFVADQDVNLTVCGMIFHETGTAFLFQDRAHERNAG